MNFRFPPSSLFNSKTACAVVPEPANESSMIEFLLVDTVTINFTNSEGLGKSNFLVSKISLSSFVP
jgi:hypothetical protein